MSKFQTPQERYASAMAVLKNPDEPLAQKLVAHEQILRFGMAGAGDSERMVHMAEALGDLCMAVAVVMTALSNPAGDA